MSVVVATITVDFTANYAGAHRVCWRVQGSGNPYNCTTSINCIGGGTTCSANFTANVNNTSCDGTVTFEGYVQAACQDVASLEGRLPWTVDYTPTPTCLRSEISCNYAEIDSISITDPGSKYLIGDTVVLTPVGADPNLQDATVTIGSVGSGVINSISGMISGGTGYTAGDILSVNLLFVPGCTGSGAQIEVDSVDGGGAILTYTLINGGSNYACDPGFTFTGGTGTGANFNIVEGTDFDILGKILSFNIVDGGSYSTVPSVTITTGTGSNFAGTVTLSDCPSVSNIGIDCVGATTVNLPAGMKFNSTWATCLTAAPVGLPFNYVVDQVGCCISSDSNTPSCFDYHIENNTGSSQTVQYTACGGNNLTSVSIPDGGSIAICAVLDGVLDLGIVDLIIDNTGNECS